MRHRTSPFLRGASSCEELFSQASVCDVEAIAIVDRNSVTGIVRAWEAAKVTNVRVIVGCRLDHVDGASLLVYPTDRAAYLRLARLLSVGNVAPERRGAISTGPRPQTGLAARDIYIPDVNIDSIKPKARNFR